MRRLAWKLMLSKPAINVWFIHNSIHPVSFGVGSVIKKPVVEGDKVVPKEILNMTILADHDLLDGAPMVRMLNDLSNAIEKGAGFSAAPVS